MIAHAYRNIASVVMTAAPYVEYLHLAWSTCISLDSATGWRIVNALWEPTDSWLATNAQAAHWFTDRGS